MFTMYAIVYSAERYVICIVLDAPWWFYLTHTLCACHNNTVRRDEGFVFEKDYLYLLEHMEGFNFIPKVPTFETRCRTM